ncbi:MAG: 4Fe-4S cluster-binding domain-containing protein, partial [Promethearchaeota archaeon]
MEMKAKGIIFDVKKYAIHDGPGIRTTVFFKGCPLRCWWCHNPEGQKEGLETIIKTQIDKNTLSDNQEETIGREVSVVEVITEIEKDQLFYDESGGGVTFSGGEPLMQPAFLNALLDACKEKELTTTLDTCGYASWNILKKIKDKIDLFLYDIKIIDNKEHQKYTGVSNNQILSNF